MTSREAFIDEFGDDYKLDAREGWDAGVAWANRQHQNAQRIAELKSDLHALCVEVRRLDLYITPEQREFGGADSHRPACVAELLAADAKKEKRDD